jgi:polyhydroxyalkanoate synthesis regulator phasin
MANFEDVVKKAFYMGVGFASYAQEKATDTLNELKTQAQKLADEMIARGEMNAEEARKFVNEIVEQAQKDTVEGTKSSESRQPRRIEIVDEEESNTPPPTPPSDNVAKDDVEKLRQQVQSLQEELRRLKKD